MKRTTPRRSADAAPAHDAEEAQFLARYSADQFQHPSVAVDLVLATVESGKLKALLLRRDSHPAKDKWALPGSFVGFEESLDAAAQRVLKQKAHLNSAFIEQLYTFGNVRRDPRTRVISVAYFALVPATELRAALQSAGGAPLALATLVVPWKGEAGGAVEARAEDGAHLPLAFDHASILGMAVTRLRGRLRYSPIAYGLLPQEFTLRMVQDVHEAILDRALNKDAFRRRLLAAGEVKPTGQLEKNVGHRPAEIYRCVPQFPAKREQ